MSRFVVSRQLIIPEIDANSPRQVEQITQSNAIWVPNVNDRLRIDADKAFGINIGHRFF